MRIIIEENKNLTETEITVRCREMTAELTQILSHISLLDHTVAGHSDGEIFFVPMRDIYYFETVDGKMFFYTEKNVYESAAKLYQIEENLEGTVFARISKTTIANLKKMRSIKPMENSRLTATMTNGERLVVSRQYVPEIKKKLGV